MHNDVNFLFWQLLLLKKGFLSNVTSNNLSAFQIINHKVRSRNNSRSGNKRSPKGMITFMHTIVQGGAQNMSRSERRGSETGLLLEFSSPGY